MLNQQLLVILLLLVLALTGGDSLIIYKLIGLGLQYGGVAL